MKPDTGIGDAGSSGIDPNNPGRRAMKMAGWFLLCIAILVLVRGGCKDYFAYVPII